MVNFTAQLLNLRAGLGSVPEVLGLNSITQQRDLHLSNAEGTACSRAAFVAQQQRYIYLLKSCIDPSCYVNSLKIEAGISWHETPQSKEKSSSVVNGQRKSRKQSLHSVQYFSVYLKIFLELSFQVCANWVRLKIHLVSQSTETIPNRECVMPGLGKDAGRVAIPATRCSSFLLFLSLLIQSCWENWELTRAKSV